jgi:TRAP-type C4-dicarboxylate transport system substrate-binding protein
VEIAKIIHRGMTSAQDTNAPTLLTGVGMQVTPLTPDQVAAFRKKAQPAVVEWVKEQIGSEWVDKLFAAIEDYRKKNY